MRPEWSRRRRRSRPATRRSSAYDGGGKAMKTTFSRRDLLVGSSALALTVHASPIKAQAPEPSAITPALIEAAKKEGKVVWYTSVDLPLSERIARTFEAKFPGIAMRV